jgi:hypothetical protein
MISAVAILVSLTLADEMSQAVCRAISMSWNRTREPSRKEAKVDIAMIVRIFAGILFVIVLGALIMRRKKKSA